VFGSGDGVGLRETLPVACLVLIFLLLTRVGGSGGKRTAGAEAQILEGVIVAAGDKSPAYPISSFSASWKSRSSRWVLVATGDGSLA
jgi:hypothetical protein